MSYERTHLDLFSGLGCWAIAARANGLRTVGFCEREEWLAAGLERIWGCPCHRDIKTFPAQEYAGRIWLLTGSPPCQPASLAGKRRGSADDRWLWDETLSVLEVVGPTWCVLENPPGIDGVGLDGIVAQMEGLGYEVALLRIPACAVDSPQDRDRFWIVGNRTGSRPPRTDLVGSARETKSRNGSGNGQPIRAAQGGTLPDASRDRSQAESPEGNVRPERARVCQVGVVANGPGAGPQGDQPAVLQGGSQCDSAQCAKAGLVAGTDSQHGRSRTGRRDRSKIINHTSKCAQSNDGSSGSFGGSGDATVEVTTDERGSMSKRALATTNPWSDFERLAWNGSLYRIPTRLHDLADGVVQRIPRKFRSKLIGALGNAIVWQVPAKIITAMIESEKSQ